MEETPTQKIVNALLQKGYSSLATYQVPNPGTFNTVREFRLYTNGLHVLCLQIYKDWACELYKPVTNDLGIQNTIDAIP